MRYKWLFAFCFLFLWPSTSYAANQILIIDDAVDRSDNSLLVEATIRSYQANVVVKPSSEAVDIHAYDAVFLFGEQAIQLPEALEEELLSYDKEVIVIGAAPKSKMFWKEWRYGDDVEIFSLNGEPLRQSVTIAEIRPPEDAEIVVAGDHFNKAYPYISRKGRQYAIASTEFKGLRQLVFNQLLAKLFPIDEGHEAFIRLTDINVNTDVEQLEQITSYLSANKVPLLLAVDNKPRTNSKQELKDNKALVQLLQELQAEGARIVFKLDGANYEKDLRLFIHLGLYPLGVETDSLLKVSEEYEEVLTNSSIYFGPIKSSENRQVQHILPTTFASLDRIFLYSDTLSDIEHTALSSSRTPAYKVDLLETVESSMISFLYHSYLGLEPLQELVEQINRIKNLKWIEWDKQQAVTKMATQTIRFSEDGKIKVENHRPLYDQWRYVWESKSTDTILWLLAGLVLLFVSLFTVYIIFMRVRLRKRLFNERK